MEVKGSNDAFQKARDLRRSMTKPERLLWWALKTDKTGFHFRKQHAAGPYVLDFYADRIRLCVEVDGPSHDFTSRRDVIRDLYLEKWGILTIRVSAEDIVSNLGGIVEHITQVARTRPLRQPSAATSPKGEEKV